MIAAMIMAVVIGFILFVVCLIVSQAILPCNQCPLHNQCKQLEENGNPNICTQKMLRAYDGIE